MFSNITVSIKSLSTVSHDCIDLYLLWCFIYLSNGAETNILFHKIVQPKSNHKRTLIGPLQDLVT